MVGINAVVIISPEWKVICVIFSFIMTFVSIKLSVASGLLSYSIGNFGKVKNKSVQSLVMDVRNVGDEEHINAKRQRELITSARKGFTYLPQNGTFLVGKPSSLVTLCSLFN